MLNSNCHSIIAYGVPIYRHDRKKASEILTNNLLEEFRRETGVEFILIIPDLAVKCEGLLFIRDLSTYDVKDQGVTANLTDLLFKVSSKHENATTVIKRNVSSKYGLKLGKEGWNYFSWCLSVLKND